MKTKKQKEIIVKNDLLAGILKAWRTLRGRCQWCGGEFEEYNFRGGLKCKSCGNIEK